ncbi:MAG: hypothetical protein IPK67_00380 [Planctomycetes bacterium]|nr:hypothetical protein [Planctomycetota bacterium]
MGELPGNRDEAPRLGGAVSSGGPAALNAERLALAVDLLREAVYQSRAKQAAGSSVSLGAAQGAAGNCGLGTHAAIEQALSPKGRELAARLWPTPLTQEAAQRAEALIETWVVRQDALDRKRNHFLRDFRTANGFDRTRYSPEQLASFETGLAKVNAEEDQRRLEAARELSAP